MKIYKIQSLLLFVLFTFSCATKNDADEKPEQIQKESATIDSLIRNADFAYSMAKTLDSSYYIGVGQTPPDFLTDADDTATIIKNVKEEKIAINLAGFYALECGIGALSAQTNQAPTEWLKKIINKTADSNAILLLNRFANATWKAGQPFRALNRITRSNFTGANFLSQEEIKKDYDQITAAATRLLLSMHDVENNPVKEQMQKLRSLLQDQQYAFEIAKFLDSSYYINLGQPAPNFLSAADDTATIRKTAKDQKIATSIAGFYALECGVNYLVTTQNKLPSDILQSIVNNTISKEDKNLFSRFANATWKAGQPFRGLNRITRDTFTPFYFLTDADIEKDFVQIKAAAQKLLMALQSEN
jgi:hypothetical protein